MLVTFHISDFFLGLELHFKADHFKSRNFISSQTTLRFGTPFEADHFKFRTPFQGPEVLYRRTTVWKKWTELFRRSGTLIRSRPSRTPLGADYDISKSGTPLEADYNISKIQTFHFEDWTLDLVIIFEDYFEGPDEAQTPFKRYSSLSNFFYFYYNECY
ncbi:hypothetical protein RclHR1_17880001 [Rhizophagus clarus]|uniref:Uncharacterized protein n=1 Tax=Rhizophagus clarus TaxID=94130 RepID=A0A2Z6RDV3_9GLOM|nr:hypothetical protein RclHR1_17880001 [Rhizophagus clarus]